MILLATLLLATQTPAPQQPPLEELKNQAELCIGTPYYLVVKALSVAREKGYPFVKILSYNLYSHGDRLHFSSSEALPEGERFFFYEEAGELEILCFYENTTQCLSLKVSDFPDAPPLLSDATKGR